MSWKVKENEYKKYDNVTSAKRIIVNPSSNDFNNEPEYKLSLVNRNQVSNEEEIADQIKDNAEVTYK